MPPKKTTKKARPNGEHVWALLVVSSGVQSDTIQHQRKWAEDTAAAKGWRITRFVDGVSSGKDGPRKLVTSILSDLSDLEPAARPKRLLMIRSDRLGRGPIVESQIVLSKLRELGVSVFTREEGEVKLDTVVEQLISAFRLGVAGMENEVRRDKMLAVYKRKRDAGQRIGNRLPYGLMEKNGKDAADPKRSKVIKEAFRMRLAGSGYHKIAQRLTSLAPPQVFKNGREVIIRWTPTRIARLLTTKAYVGPILDESTFARAQLVSASMATNDRDRDKRRKFPWPLSGVLRCYCGRAMTGMASGEEDRRIRYYTCRANWNHGGSNRLVRADNLEDQFADFLDVLELNPESVKEFEQQSGAPAESRKVAEKALTEAKRQLANLDRQRDAVWDLQAAGKVRAEDVQERLDRLSGRRDDVRGRIDALQEQIALSNASVEQKRDARKLIKQAAYLWIKCGRVGRIEDQKEVARLVSLSVDGFCVDARGRLVAPGPVVHSAQRRSHKKTGMLP